MKKVYILALAVIVVAVLIAFVSYFSVQETITLFNQTDITSEQTNQDILSATKFIIDYNFRSAGNYTVQKLVFKDDQSAGNYMTFLTNLTSTLTSNRTAISFGEYEGSIFDTLNLDSGRINGFGIFLKKGDTLVFVFGEEKEPLIKVTEWFIKHY
jgi:hypothetical protein